MTERAFLANVLPMIVLFVGLLTVCAVGFKVGQRPGGAEKAARAGIDGVLGPVLTLLSLLLGFSVSIAESHFAARRALAVDEANAIGSAFLRTRLVPPPGRRDLAELLRRYAAARSVYYELDRAGDEDQGNAALTKQLQDELWAKASALGEQAPTHVTTGLLVSSLNEVFDLEESERTAYDTRLPTSIVGLLVVASMAAMGMVGFRFGLMGPRHRFLTSLVAALLASTLYVVLDLDRSQQGFIRFRNESLRRLSLGEGRPQDF